MTDPTAKPPVVREDDIARATEWATALQNGQWIRGCDDTVSRVVLALVAELRSRPTREEYDLLEKGASEAAQRCIRYANALAASEADIEVYRRGFEDMANRAAASESEVLRRMEEPSEGILGAGERRMSTRAIWSAMIAAFRKENGI